MNDNETKRPLIYYSAQLDSDEAMVTVPVRMIRAPHFDGFEGDADMLVPVAVANRLRRKAAQAA